MTPQCRVEYHDADAQASVTASVCELCSHRGRRAVLDLVEAWLRLCHGLRKDGGAGTDSPVTSAVTESSPPLKVHALDTAREIESKLAGYYAYYRIQRNLTPTWRAEPLLRVRTAANVLAGDWERFLATPAAPDMLGEIVALRDRAFRLLKLNPLVHQLPLPCPYCDVRDLHRPNGEDWQQCRSCHRYVSADEYEIAVKLALEEVRCPSTPG